MVSAHYYTGSVPRTSCRVGEPIYLSCDLVMLLQAVAACNSLTWLQLSEYCSDGINRVARCVPFQLTPMRSAHNDASCILHNATVAGDARRYRLHLHLFGKVLDTPSLLAGQQLLVQL
jgi:hypothetical protein